MCHSARCEIKKYGQADGRTKTITINLAEHASRGLNIYAQRVSIIQEIASLQSHCQELESRSQDSSTSSSDGEVKSKEKGCKEVWCNEALEALTLVH